MTNQPNRQKERYPTSVCASRPYLEIVQHYEECLRQHGDTHRGVDWPKLEDVKTRYRVMLDVIRRSGQAVTLLDFGCGAAHLYEHLATSGASNIHYSGLDISADFVALCRAKFPDVPFYQADLLAGEVSLPTFDYVVMNGVFTEKRGVSYDSMLEYFQQLLKIVWAHARVGIAFNVMSKHVDWERDDLFHLPLDTLAAILVSQLSRNFVIRSDYGLYEYTVYVYQ